MIIDCLTRRETCAMYNKNAGCKAAALKRFPPVSTAGPLCAAASHV